MDIGKAIRDYRKLNLKTLQIVSEQSGISKSYLSDLENNKRNIDLRHLVMLAKVYKVPVYHIVKTAESYERAIH
jgi:transcriptional regulator with XRE-family HTH domain